MNTIAGAARREMQAVFNDLYGKMSRRELIQWKGVDCFPTIDLVREIFRERVRQIINTPGAIQSVDPSKPIGVQCKDCKKVHMIPRDVRVFKCCTHEEQWVVKSRSLDLIP